MRQFEWVDDSMAIKGTNKYRDEDIQRDIKSFFQDEHHWAYEYGGPSRCGTNSPYHRKQIELLFEERYPHWATHRNVDFLIQDGFLKEKDERIAKFVYRSDIRYIQREINRRKKIILRYSDTSFDRAIGRYAEMLFGFMFRLNSFKIIGRHANEYKGKQWQKTKHDFDFIIEKDGVAYGVEIKNTLPYMEREESDVKLEMCECLNLVPLWILRNAPGVQFEQMKAVNGFILKFKSWIIPLGQEPLARDIWDLMRLPVAIWEETPKRLENIFLRQHSERIS
jgi:hypothetical protein